MHGAGNYWVLRGKDFTEGIGQTGVKQLSTGFLWLDREVWREMSVLYTYDLSAPGQ